MASKTEVKIQIPAPNIQIMKVKINGLTPLIYHKWDEKAIKMIEDKQQKKATKAREVRDPEAETVNSVYYDASGYVSLPARNVKQAIVGSARFLSGVPMTVLRGSIFVVGDVDGFINVKSKGKLVTRKEIEDNVDTWMRKDMVTVGMGSADVRYRAQVDKWTMEFMVKFNADVLSAEQVLNLLQTAGFSQGLGEWRPEKNGDNGTFEVDTTWEATRA